MLPFAKYSTIKSILLALFFSYQLNVSNHNGSYVSYKLRDDFKCNYYPYIFKVKAEGMFVIKDVI